MRHVPFTVLVVLLGVTGLALAKNPGGSREEVETPVPLTVYDARGETHTYLLKCSNGSRDLPTCRGLSVWEDVNDLDGLQSQKIHAGRWFDPDVRTLA